MRRRSVIVILISLLVVLSGGLYPIYGHLFSGGNANGELTGYFEWQYEQTTNTGDGQLELQLAEEEEQAISLSSIEVELVAQLPEVGDVVMVYRVKQPVITVEAVTELAGRLSIEGDVAVIEHPSIIPDDPAAGVVFRINDMDGDLLVFGTSGGWSYVGNAAGSKLFAYPNPELDLSADREIARQFLEERGLLPPGAKISEKVGGRVDGVPSHGLILFTGEINGLRTTGERNKIAVRVANGEVVQIDAIWREVEPYRELLVLTPEQAYQDLLSGKGQHDATIGTSKVVIEQMSLAYYIDPAPAKQEYVIPVYEFIGKSYTQFGIESFTGYCTAFVR